MYVWLRRFSRLGAALATCSSLLALPGCGSGGSSPGPAAQTDTTGKQVAEFMQRWYWWLDDMPSADAASFASGRDALAALRVSADRYSFSEPTASFNAFFVSGTTVGFGLAYEVEGTGSAATLKVRYTQPASNAATAFSRGDRILSIHGESVGMLISGNRLEEAFGPADEGLMRRFELERLVAGVPTRLNVQVAKSRYRIASSFGARMIEPAESGVQRRIAYLHLFTFTSNSSADWLDALAGLQAQAFDDLIVDLRDNGGGSVQAANVIASSLVAGQQGAPSIGLRFNRLNAASDQQLRFVAVTPSLNPARLVWLTSARTCSAAEELIHALEPYRTAATTASIGATTCGKPVGFTPQVFGDRTYSIVTFQSANRDGPANYFTGLPPTCPVSDPGRAPYGSLSDPLLAGALLWLGSGACPQAGSSALEKALAPTPQDPLTGLRRAERFSDLLGLR